MIRSLAIVLALSAAAAAQPAPSEPTESPELLRAKQMYAEGKRYYDVGDYPRAIETWKRAYVVSSAPMLLFNIAQAYRLSGDCVQALRVYASYEREAPGAPNKDELEQAKARCNREPTATNPPAATTAPVATTNPVTPARPLTSAELRSADVDRSSSAPSSPPPPHDVGERGGALRTAGIATGAGGAVLVIASLYFAKTASDRADSVSDFRGEWTTEQRAVEREGQRARTWSIVTGVAGGAALVGGAVLFYAGHRAQRSHLDVALTPSRAEVQWSVSF